MNSDNFKLNVKYNNIGVKLYEKGIKDKNK